MSHPLRLSISLTGAVSALSLFASVASAQQLELPRQSPSAKVSQVVGLTEVSVDYSSPAAKGRKIFGGLVPFGQLWRTGANGATKITFSKDVTIDDKPVPAGTYALFSIPTATGWTLILNKNPNQGGTDQYKQDLDVARFMIKPQPIPPRERLTFLFNNTSESATSLDLEWDKVRVSLPIKAGTDAQVAANIKGLESGAWRPWNNAARYLLESKKDLDQAMGLIDRSIAMKEDWFNVWTKAQIVAAKGKAAEACPLAQKAQALGEKEKADAFFFAAEVKKAIADWKCK